MKTFKIIQFFIFLIFVSSNQNSINNNTTSNIFLMIITCIVLIIIIIIILYLCKFKNQNSKEESNLLKKKKLFLFQKIIIPVKYNFFEFKKYGNKCIICLNNFGKTKNVCITPCNHIFHHKCLRKYIFESKFPYCPLCKYDLFISLNKISINYKGIKIPEKELSLDNEDESENNNYINDIKIYDGNYSEQIYSKDNNSSIRENNSQIKLNVNKKTNKFLFSNNIDYFHNKQNTENLNDSKKETIINEHKVVHLTEI
jgi:hypothetical protein